MKKNTKAQTAMLKRKLSDCPAGSIVGMDIGDRWTHAAVLASDGELLLEERIESREPVVRRWLTKLTGCVVAMEVGTHSRWMSKVGVECGHEVLVANPRRLRLIYGDDNKHDRLDAKKLARLARLDRELLYRVRHRPEQEQGDLARIAVREKLVEMRTGAVNLVRGMVKAAGGPGGGVLARSFPGESEGSDSGGAAGWDRADVGTDPGVERADSGMRTGDRGGGAGAVSGGGVANAGGRSGVADGADVPADDLQRDAVRAEPGRGLLRRAAAAAEPVGGVGSAVGDHEGGQREITTAVGELRALHSGAVREGQRSAALGARVYGEQPEAWGEAAGGSGGGAEAGGTAAPAVSGWRSLRAAARSRKRDGSGIRSLRQVRKPPGPG